MEGGMKKIAITVLSILTVASFGVALGCGETKAPSVVNSPSTIINGGFESADLSGWTVEYGNAFDDDCVSSVKTFAFPYDEKQNALSVNQTG